MLQQLVNNEVVVKIKWGQEYTGRLVSVDSYMNLLLGDTQEWSAPTEGSEAKGGERLGQVLIRCNNVLWISKRGADGKGGVNGDVKMEG